MNLKDRLQDQSIEVTHTVAISLSRFMRILRTQAFDEQFFFSMHDDVIGHGILGKEL